MIWYTDYFIANDVVIVDVNVSPSLPGDYEMGLFHNSKTRDPLY